MFLGADDSERTGMTRSKAMRALPLLGFLLLPPLAACSAIPGSGPPAGAVAAQGRSQGRVLFDVVPVDDRVVATVRAEPQPSLAARFKEHGKPPELRIAVGDTLRVLLWQMSQGAVLAPSQPVPLPLGPALPVPRVVSLYRPLLRVPGLMLSVAPQRRWPAAPRRSRISRCSPMGPSRSPMWGQ